MAHSLIYVDDNLKQRKKKKEQDNWCQCRRYNVKWTGYFTPSAMQLQKYLRSL